MDKIKKILEENNLTQVWLARKLEVADAQLNRWLNGVNIPNYKTVEKIYKILDKELKK